MRKTTGISLLLLIFLSLSLIIFSLLSYSGAQADARLSQKAADHTTEYYQMTDQANQILAFIDTQIGSLIHTDSDFSERLSTAFPDIHFVYEENTAVPTLTFQTQTNTAAQALQVTLEFVPPSADTDPLYQITCWQIVHTQDWTPDQSQKLMRLPK